MFANCTSEYILSMFSKQVLSHTRLISLWVGRGALPYYINTLSLQVSSNFLHVNASNSATPKSSPSAVISPCRHHWIPLPPMHCHQQHTLPHGCWWLPWWHFGGFGRGSTVTELLPWTTQMPSAQLQQERQQHQHQQYQPQHP